MVNEISNWAGGIVTSVIIITILEMLIPEGKNKKYIKTVLGIYLLFTIISPIAKAITGDEINLKNIIQIDEFKNKNTNIHAIETNASIEKIYETNLKEDIMNKLAQKGYEANKIDLKIELEDKNNYGRINHIYVQIREKENGTSKQTINKIEKINIEIENNLENIQERTSLSQIETQKIKTYISTIYNVAENIITIE